MAPQPDDNDIDIASLKSAGLDDAAVDAWVRTRPRQISHFAVDGRICSAFFRASKQLIARLPVKARRSEAEKAAAELISQEARRARTRFLSAHATELYDGVTDLRSRFLSLSELLAAAAAAVPGLVPTAQELEADRNHPLADKSGVEIDQGLFLSAVLASEAHGRHLCHTMLLPRREAADLVPKLTRDGVVDLGGAAVERRGQASVVTMQNPRYLNAEDETTLDAMATCVDLALLDPETSVAVLRGGPVEHPKYRGRRIFGAGINLTHLYQGRIPYLWYLERDLGYVHKIYRGLASPDAPPDDVHGETREKPWIAAVERFAIGGHCQLLLVSDYIIAESDAYLTLPARKEGIIPGMANLRLPRFVGDRIARQAIQYERRIDCAQPDGRLICDEIVESGAMDEAIARVVTGLSTSGVVSAAANRRAIRVGQEPLDLFRGYAAVYAREQAECHFSPALIRNLERYWNEREE
ncbi:MAG: enoyl-CoA hydratase/isomerase family protein [Xanthobacteraceae bacterium]